MNKVISQFSKRILVLRDIQQIQCMWFLTICIWGPEQEVEFETDSKESKQGIGIRNLEAWQVSFIFIVLRIIANSRN